MEGGNLGSQPTPAPPSKPTPPTPSQACLTAALMDYFNIHLLHSSFSLWIGGWLEEYPSTYHFPFFRFSVFTNEYGKKYGTYSINGLSPIFPFFRIF